MGENLIRLIEKPEYVVQADSHECHVVEVRRKVISTVASYEEAQALRRRLQVQADGFGNSKDALLRHHLAYQHDIRVLVSESVERMLEIHQGAHAEPVEHDHVETHNHIRPSDFGMSA